MVPESRVARLYKMAIHIMRNPGSRVAELARLCNVSERQIYRDKKTLEAAGFPIYYDGGYRMAEWRLILKSLVFTMEEAMALIYSLKVLEQQKEVFRAPKQLQEKILSILPPSFRNTVEDVSQQVEVTVTPAADYTDKGPFFKIINKAIQNRIFLRVRYYSFHKDKVDERLLAPLQLVFQDGFWYMVAFCQRNNEPRLFRVDRISDMEKTLQRFTALEEYSFDEYMGAAWHMERGEEFSFKVRFYAQTARYIQETNFHHSQEIVEESEGSILFKARACSYSSILRWVLPFGEEAEVLEPEELRKMVRRALQKSLKRYE